MSSDPFDEELLALASNPFSDDPSISLTSLSSIAPLISQQQPQPQHLQQLQQKHHLHQQSYSIPLQDHDLTDYPSTKQLSSSSTPASQSGTLRFQLSYRDPKNLPSEAIKLLNDALGPNIDALELFSHIANTRLAADAWARGDKQAFKAVASFSSSSSPSDSIVVPKQRKGLRKFLDKLFSPDDDGFRVRGSDSGRGDETRNTDLLRDEDVPPIPNSYTSDDSIGLAIYYHERDEMRVSMYYLEKAAKEGHPLGCYLRAMALRHGLGVKVDRQHAFRALLQAAEMALLTIPDVATKSHQQRQSITSSSYMTTTTKDRSSSVSSRTPSMLRSLESYANIAKVLPEDLEVALALLPLPLYEIGICFQQGWGCAKTPSAALYYFSAAAHLGDADAMYECGFAYLNSGGGRSAKMRAAEYLRGADKGGKRVVGESWIFKRKWGGEEKDA